MYYTFFVEQILIHAMHVMGGFKKSHPDCSVTALIKVVLVTQPSILIAFV